MASVWKGVGVSGCIVTLSYLAWASLRHSLPSTCAGRGRGRQVIAVARTADVVVMMLDATKGDVQRSVQQDRGTHGAGTMYLWLKGSVSNLATTQPRCPPC